MLEHWAEYDWQRGLSSSGTMSWVVGVGSQGATGVMLDHQIERRPAELSESNILYLHLCISAHPATSKSPSGIISPVHQRPSVTRAPPTTRAATYYSRRRRHVISEPSLPLIPPPSSASNVSLVYRL